MRLVITKNDQPFEELILEKDSVRVGRLATSDVHLDAAGVSRFHAVIERVRGGFAVTNMGTGETFVAGKTITRATLAGGDLFQIGAFKIAVHQAGELEVLQQVPATEEEDAHPSMAHALWSASEEEMSEVPVTGEIDVNSELGKLQQEGSGSEHALWTATEKEMSEVPVTGEIDVNDELSQVARADLDRDAHPSLADARWTASEEELAAEPVTGEIRVSEFQRDLAAESGAAEH